MAIATDRWNILTHYRIDYDGGRVRLQRTFIKQASQDFRLNNVVCLKRQTTPRNISQAIKEKPPQAPDHNQNDLYRIEYCHDNPM